MRFLRFITLLKLGDEMLQERINEQENQKRVVLILICHKKLFVFLSTANRPLADPPILSVHPIIRNIDVQPDWWTLLTQICQDRALSSSIFTSNPKTLGGRKQAIIHIIICHVTLHDQGYCVAVAAPDQRELWPIRAPFFFLFKNFYFVHIYFCIFMGMSACMDGTFCYFKSKLSDLSSDPLPVWVNFRDSETNWDSSVHHLYPFVDFFNLNFLVWLSFSLQNTLSLLIYLRREKVDMACKFRLPFSPFFIKKKKKVKCI